MAINQPYAAATRLRAAMRGDVLTPDDDEYEEARLIYNGMIDKRPALIARCRGAGDIVAAVKVARDEGLTVAIRGGGHNVAGLATCDDGLMIDLSRMRDVRVDPVGRTLRCGPGTLWSDFDREAAAFGLGTTGGMVSHTGVAGLTLGGGVGWLGRSYGLSCDNLLEADVVLADGSLVTASAEQNADLFWALRGGGGNFGVVTSFLFRLHPVSSVFAGLVVYPISRAREVLAANRALTESAPDALAAIASLGTAPDGAPIVAVGVCYNGPADDGERLIRPIRALGPALVDTIAEQPYWEFNCAFDDGRNQPRLRHYWKTSFAREVGEAATDTAIEYFTRAPELCGSFFIEQYGGAAGRVRPEDTAFPHRDATFNYIVTNGWTDRAEDEGRIAWVREMWQTMRPFAGNAAYMNMLGEGSEPADRVRAAYGGNYERLASIKAAYDPTNFFHRNHNIVPASR